MMMSYLGRGEKQYSECGFLYFNMQHKDKEVCSRNEIYV